MQIGLEMRVVIFTESKRSPQATTGVLFQAAALLILICTKVDLNET